MEKLVLCISFLGSVLALTFLIYFKFFRKNGMHRLVNGMYSDYATNHDTTVQMLYLISKGASDIGTYSDGSLSLVRFKMGTGAYFRLFEYKDNIYYFSQNRDEIIKLTNSSKLSDDRSIYVMFDRALNLGRDCILNKLDRELLFRLSSRNDNLNLVNSKVIKVDFR